MALLPEVSHPVRSFPIRCRALLVVLLTTSWVAFQISHASGDGVWSLLLIFQILAALLLIGSAGVGDGVLRFNQHDWFWRGERVHEIQVSVAPVIDVGGLLCLRMMPSCPNQVSSWAWPAWVWASFDDPKTRMAFRLALHCSDGHDRRLI